MRAVRGSPRPAERTISRLAAPARRAHPEVKRPERLPCLLRTEKVDVPWRPRLYAMRRADQERGCTHSTPIHFSRWAGRPASNLPRYCGLCFYLWAGCAINVGPRSPEGPARIGHRIIGQSSQLTSKAGEGGRSVAEGAAASHELLPVVLDVSGGAQLQADLPRLRILHVLLGFLLEGKRGRPDRAGILFKHRIGIGHLEEAHTWHCE